MRELHKIKEITIKNYGSNFDVFDNTTGTEDDYGSILCIATTSDNYPTKSNVENISEIKEIFHSMGFSVPLRIAREIREQIISNCGF